MTPLGAIIYTPEYMVYTYQDPFSENIRIRRRRFSQKQKQTVKKRVFVWRVLSLQNNLKPWVICPPPPLSRLARCYLFPRAGGFGSVRHLASPTFKLTGLLGSFYRIHSVDESREKKIRFSCQICKVAKRSLFADA